jgi:Protein of unknown function (DUF4232)
MIKYARISLAAVAAALALAGGSAALASAGTAPAPANARVPRCDAQRVSASLHGFQADLANRGFMLTVTNEGNIPCSVDGYAGLKLENAAHHLVRSKTSEGDTYFDPDNPGPHLIVLSPGETVSADFAFFSGTGGSTDSVATYLLVTPPGTSKSVIVRLPGAPIRIYLGELAVTAFSRHTPYFT